MKKSLLFLVVVNLFNINTYSQTVKTKILMKTTMGDFVLGLYEETPLHKANFLKLVKQDYFKGVLFHRVINKFMIQAGDPISKTAGKGDYLGMGDIGYTIPAEILPTLIHKKGVLSAARSPDHVNPKKASSGCQFYIVQGNLFDIRLLEPINNPTGVKYTPEQKEIYKKLGGTPHLDGQYTIFGELIKGLDVLDKIAVVKTDPQDRPLEDIKILSTQIIK